MSSQSVPPGGPSTINGVLYQLLYSLLTLGKYRIENPELIGEELQSVTLVIEPSDGGDQQIRNNDKRVITQIKARSTGNSWSLQDLICKVLPDLYRAVELSGVPSEFQFVTEGRMGRWKEALEFFKQIGPLPTTGDCLESLDDETIVYRARVRADSESQGESENFWNERSYTKRGLFEKIVETLRERQQVRLEPIEETRKKTWTLLQKFKFIGGVTHGSLKIELDRWLLEQIADEDRLPEKRDHLLLELGRRACSANALIESKEFFVQMGLNDTALSDWARLTKKASDYLYGVLKRKQIVMVKDVRHELTNTIISGWTDERPIVVLGGESGCGKSWHGYRSLISASEQGDVSILVDSHGDFGKDTEEISKTFWHSIVGNDNTVPIERLRSRLQRIDPSNVNRRISILVDNVTCKDELKRLIEMNWEGFRIRLAITCDTRLANIANSLLSDRGQIMMISEYSDAELRSYITEVAGINWRDVPVNVRKTIRRPILAYIFGELVSGTQWQPSNEFEIIEKAWNSIRTRGVNAFVIDGLRCAASKIVSNEIAYPWSAGSLRDCRLDHQSVELLISSGWLRETTDGDFEVWHNRLLNWTVAEAIVHEMIRRPDRVGDRISWIATNLYDVWSAKQPALFDVPRDIMWILADKGTEGTGLFQRLIAECETRFGWSRASRIYTKILASMGERAVPFFHVELVNKIDSSESHIVNNIVNGLASVGGSRAGEIAIEFLNSDSKKQCLAGVRLIASLPSIDSLDRLWEIHIHCQANPLAYSEDEHQRTRLYRATFKALKACVALKPDWLESKIELSHSNSEPVHDLAYLVAAIGDRRIWLSKKEKLMDQVASSHPRSIATCIYTFRDREEIDWIEAQVSNTDDWVGIDAFRALIAINPDRAIITMNRPNDDLVHMAHDYCFSELHVRLPEQVMSNFAERLRSHHQPLQYAFLLQGQEDLIDIESFEYLLDRLSESFEAAISPDCSTEKLADCRSGLMFMNKVARPELLDRIRLRRGTPLECNIEKWRISLGHECNSSDHFDVVEALTRIGGDGFNRVIDHVLENDFYLRKLRGLSLSLRREADSTKRILSKMSELRSIEVYDGLDDLSERAVTALACFHQWRPVFRFLLDVGCACSDYVHERFPVIDQPLEDTVLTDVISHFGNMSEPLPGAVLIIGLLNRKDLLPNIKSILSRSEPGSDLAKACLIALLRFRDDDPMIVSAIARNYEAFEFLVTQLLQVNASDEACVEITQILRRNPNIELALILANNLKYRQFAVDSIRSLAQDQTRFDQFTGALMIVASAQEELLSILVDIPELFELADVVAYDTDGFYNDGVVSAALRILAVKQPRDAVAEAMARLGGRKQSAPENYVSVISSFAPKPVDIFFELCRLELSRKAIRAIGLELGAMDIETEFLERLRSSDTEERLVACRIAGFLPYSEILHEAIRTCAGDADMRIADAAVEAHKRLLKTKVSENLIIAFANESDITHRWVMLDALISVSDPGYDDIEPQWISKIQSILTPAMFIHLSKGLEHRRRKVIEELDKADMNEI